MNFRLSSCRLMVATYGTAFTPNEAVPPHELSTRLDGASDIRARLERFQKEWETDAPSALAAMNTAHQQLSEALSLVLNSQIEVQADEPVYKVIYDKWGNPIGHDTISWVFQSGVPMVKEEQEDGRVLGMIACIYLATVPA